LLTGKEPIILNEFWRILHQTSHESWAYYTGSNDKSAFDPRGIVARSWVNRVPVPSGIISDRGYYSGCFVDLAQIFLAGGNFPAYVSADAAAKKLGLIGADVGFTTVRSKEDLEAQYGVCGKNFHEYVNSDDPEKRAIATVYLGNDLAIERAIANLIAN